MPKVDLYMNLPEFTVKIQKYIDECKKDKSEITPPGLANCAGITQRRLEQIIEVYETDKDCLKDGEIQPGHAKVLYNAVLKMRGEVHQSSQAMAMFKLKQKIYGGYSDKQDSGVSIGKGSNVSIHINGAKKGDELFK